MLMIHDHGLIAQILETILLILLHKNSSGTWGPSALNLWLCLHVFITFRWGDLHRDSLPTEPHFTPTSLLPCTSKSVLCNSTNNDCFISIHTFPWVHHQCVLLLIWVPCENPVNLQTAESGHQSRKKKTLQSNVDKLSPVKIVSIQIQLQINMSSFIRFLYIPNI